MKPILLMSNDWHMKKDNISELHALIREKCALAVEHEISLLVLGGDLFDSRVSQRQTVLNGMLKAFDIIEEYGLHALVIPGNHDKTKYTSEDSFLDSYKTHPAITLVRGYDVFEHEGTLVHMLPYFEYGCELHDQYLRLAKENVDPTKHNVLIGHMSVEGSVNNDGSTVSGGLNRGELKMFDLVLLGHYHDLHSIGKNIVHCPSIRQNNFGEDQNKGFTMLFDDLTYEFVNPDFTKYNVFYFDLDTDNVGDIIDKANEVFNNCERNRFELIGSRETVKGFDAMRFEAMGIDVKKKYMDLEPTAIGDSPVVGVGLKVWDESAIEERFDGFCGGSKLDPKQGSWLLTKIMNRSNGKE